MNFRFCAVLSLLLLPSALGAQAPSSKESMRGLSGVYIHVLPLQKELEANGLSATEIHKVVEGAVRKAGIVVYDTPQPVDGNANLAIVIDTVKHPQGPVIYGVEVSLLQEVHLMRQPNTNPTPGQTWSAKAIGLTSANQLHLILEPLGAKVGEFVRDFVAANPKPPR